MNRPPADLPERLLAADATDFERRLLEAAAESRPSRLASARMARALGVTAALGVTTGAATVRDLWSHTDLGSFSGSYTASSVPSHGVVMLKVVSTP